MIFRKHGFRGGLFLAVAACFCTVNAFGQSKMAAAFGNFRRTGDDAALRKELLSAGNSAVDLQVEIPVLVDIISFSNNIAEQTAASSEVCLLAYLHQTETDVFRPAIDAFERHLSDPEEKVPWGIETVMLHAFLNVQPNRQALALIYKMTDDKSTRAQGFAFAALARLKPIPKEAKDLFRSRLTKQEGKVSGPVLLEDIEYALSDPDVVLMAAAAAESRDVEEQRTATRLLARMNPMPPQVVDVFRRLQKREDLDQGVAEKVHAAIDRIDHVPPVRDKQ